MRKHIKPFMALSVLLMTSCSLSGVSSADSVSSSSLQSSVSSVSSLAPIAIDDLDTYVYQEADLTPFVKDLGEDYTCSYEGNNIRIEGNKIIGLKANTLTDVVLKTASGRKGTFQVKVINRDYDSNHKTAESNEGWFNPVTVEKIDGLAAKTDFINGIDISSSKYLYDLGAKYYNEDGDEQSLYQILKEHGVNWVRLRLWNDPSDGDFLYGGGNCTLANVKWMAKEASQAGLKYLLDFHYSDFWADPSNQVVPKAWKSLTSVSQYAKAIYDYTSQVLTELKAEDALPSMVQIGNETVGGMLRKLPGSSQTSPNGGEPTYISGSTSLSSALAGNYTQDGDNTNLVTYISSGIKAVKDFDSSILTMIHLAKGLSGTDFITKYYQTFADVDYDVIGLSCYSYWHFSSISALQSSLSVLSKAFPTKKICVAETSYGFTYETDSYANNSFQSSSSASCHPLSGYACSTQGQASLVRDLIASVSSLVNGLGTFYWEWAWIPIRGGGWSDSQSKASWANQGFFSYDGKVLGSLSVYSKAV